MKDSIESYIQGRTPAGYHYNSLEFGELYVIKDEEIKKLDKLIEEMNYLPLQADKNSEEEFQNIVVPRIINITDDKPNI